MRSNINFKVDMDTSKFKKQAEQVSHSLTKVGREDTKMGNAFAASSKKIKDQGNKFANITKDANRSANALGKLRGAFGMFAGFAGFSILAKGIESTINASMDAIETQNLFNVALGDTSKAAQAVVDNLSEAYGLDPTNLQSSIATYALLAKSMGMTSDQSETLSTQLARAAIDYSSLMNIPVNQVMADLKSGLVGQSETVYKYGMDVTEAGLKAEAALEGITESTRQMTQGQKMVLRYNTMMRNAMKDLGNGVTIMGDFGRTINSPANQVKILTDRFTTLTRAIGDIFMPVVALVLPYINGLAIVAIKAAKGVASLMAAIFGYEKAEQPDMGEGLGTIEEGADDATDAIDGATSAAKKLKKTILGIDELNLMAKPTESSSGSGVAGGGIDIGDMDLLSPYDMLEKFPSKADAVAKAIEALLKPAIDDLSESFGNVIEFGRTFSYYVLEPIASWTMGVGIPALFGAFASFNREVVPKIKDNLLPVVGKLWSDFLEPILTFTLTEAVPAFFDLLGDFVEGVSPIIDAVVTALVEIWNNFLKPLAGWVIGTGFDVLGDFFVSVGTFLKENPMAMDFLTELVKQLILLSAIKFTADKLAPFVSMLKALPAEGSGFLKLLNSEVGGKGTTGAAAAKYGVSRVDTTGKIVTPTTATQNIAGVLAGISIGTIVGNWLTGSDLAGNVGSVFNDIFSGAAEAAGASVAGYFQYVFSGGFLESVADTSTPLGYLAKLEISMLQSIQSFFGTIGSNIKGAWDGYWKIISDNWNGFKKWLGEAGSNLGKFFGSLWTNITGYFVSLPSWFAGVFSRAWQNIKSIFSPVGSFFGGIWETIKSTFGSIGKSVGDTMGGAFKNAVNSILSFAETTINGFIKSINKVIDVINDIPGVNIGKLSTLSIPRMATGGIVTSSTFAEIGEAGAEAVIPLNRNALSKYLEPVLGNNNNEMNYDTMVEAFDEALSRHEKDQTEVNNIYVDGVYSGTVSNARRRNTRAGKVVIPIGV